MIPIYIPWLTDVERSYLLKTFDTGWISSNGPMVREVEAKFASFLGAKRAYTANSGTNALHLCLLGAGIKRGDKVATASMTFAATAFAMTYCGAEPYFIDSHPTNWNMDLNHLREVCEDLRSRGESLKAVVVVHIFGNPVDMDVVMDMSKEYGFLVIEDACESFGTTFGGKVTGLIGDIGCFSFYGNKTITAGEGGVVVSNNVDLAERALLLRGQAVDPYAPPGPQRYWHVDIGHNYRMTCMQAAILMGQLERFEEIKREKIRLFETYKRELEGVVEFQEFHEKADVLPWIVAIRTPLPYSELNAFLRDRGIDSRPFFYAMQVMPPYESYAHHRHEVTDQLVHNGAMLPSYPQLTDGEIKTICDAIKEAVHASEHIS